MPSPEAAVPLAVSQGMSQSEHSSEVRLAAVKTLYNALGFAQANFKNEMERNFFMRVLCETVVSNEVEIRQTAFECLVSISSMYYDYLEPYMSTLFTLTANAIKGDEEHVALQAIEFWSSICGEEINIQDEKMLSLLVRAGLEFWLNAMQDLNSHVKDTTA